MPDDIIRAGFISAVNYKDGTAQVVYKDRDNSLSPFMPLWANEYNPPDIDTLVYVIHLPNGGTRGMIIVPPYTDGNRPAEGREGLWRKELGDGNFLRYDRKTKQLDIMCGKVRFGGNLEIGGDVCVTGNLTVGGTISQGGGG